MPDDMSPPRSLSTPASLPHHSSLLQLLTLVLVARGEAPLSDGVVGGESLLGDGAVRGDRHGQDAGVGDHTARRRLAAIPANVRTH